MTKTYIKDYTNTFNIRGTEIKVTAPAKFDADTNEIVADSELDNKAVKLAQDKYRKKYDFIGPEEIKALRKKWKISQKRLAEIIGWSPSTVALYEVGEIPTISNNRLLKVLIKHPQVMQDFIAESKSDHERKEM
ncbi:type II TA system antitoxin MqsA family protein [uncultured Lactobacillus sp.]|uniref:type II TA system antitoxin MqsA family protein n=1 Tax=uncultured Lactobacillus sp. TaxID=153152 RepID=UPI00262E1436|nr:type II TA system antitoxin MqsA family protein [uncultured Lactobacillus sp.]